MKRYLLLLGICFVMFLLPGLTASAASGRHERHLRQRIELRQRRRGQHLSDYAPALPTPRPPSASMASTRCWPCSIRNTGKGLCNDDDSQRRRTMPPTCRRPVTSRHPASARRSISARTAATSLANVSLVVGGYGNQSGEFLLILEGMGVTSGDGAGDPFSVNLTPGMVDSGVPLTSTCWRATQPA